MEVMNPFGLTKWSEVMRCRVYCPDPKRLESIVKSRGIVVEKQGGHLVPWIVSGDLDWKEAFAGLEFCETILDKVMIVPAREDESPSYAVLGRDSVSDLLREVIGATWPTWELRACAESDVSVFGRFYSGEMTSVSVAVDKLAPRDFVVRGVGWFGVEVIDSHSIATVWHL